MRTTRRAAVIRRFEIRERARQQMRFFELSSLVGIYANARCGGDIDAGYRELIDALDHVGFLGSRVLYLNSDIRPPYFSEPIKSKEDFPQKPLPHKKNPIITRQFIEHREKELGWPIVRDTYLAKSWALSLYAALWLQSKGIAPPSSISWSLKARDAAGTDKVPAGDRRKTWKRKSGNRLTDGEAAVCEAFNALWPNGEIDHKAKARNRAINDWLRDQGRSPVSLRVIQRALNKITNN
jgi:hypothetical protein